MSFKSKEASRSLMPRQTSRSRASQDVFLDVFGIKEKEIEIVF